MLCREAVVYPLACGVRLAVCVQCRLGLRTVAGIQTEVFNGNTLFATGKLITNFFLKCQKDINAVWL